VILEQDHAARRAARAASPSRQGIGRKVVDAIQLAVTLAARIESGFEKMAAEHDPTGAAGYRIPAKENLEDRAAREVAAAKQTLARPSPPRSFREIPTLRDALLVIGLLVALGVLVYMTLLH
jgi:hypothetical protein